MIKQNEGVSFRDKITLVSFLLSVGVVYQHTQWNYNGTNILTYLQQGLFYVLEACVPCFFMISGYLFFRTYTPQKVKQKLLSRVKTLLIPYLIWNLIYAIFMVGMKRLGLIKNIVIENNWGGVLLQLINAEFSPLWFVKYLMAFVLISPLLFYVLKHRVGGVIIIVAMLMLNVINYATGIMQIPIDVNSNNLVMLNYQLIYYIIGGYAALNMRKIIESPSRKKSGIAFIVIGCLAGFYLIVNVFLKKGNAITGHGFRLIYSCALWFAFDIIPAVRVRGWMKDSFFLYCSHLIVLQCIQRATYILLGEFVSVDGLFSVIEYILLPIAIIIVILMIGEFMKKKLLPVWNILTGSRG